MLQYSLLSLFFLSCCQTAFFLTIAYFIKRGIWRSTVPGVPFADRTTPLLAAPEVAKNEGNSHLQRLLSLLEEDIFLDPTLDLAKLADLLEISPSYASRLINTLAGGGFSHFINSRRIEYVKKLMIDPEFNHYTLTAMGLEAGFNSKSTFYATFQKFEKMSPGAYRQIIQQDLNNLRPTG